MNVLPVALTTQVMDQKELITLLWSIICDFSICGTTFNSAIEMGVARIKGFFFLCANVFCRKFFNFTFYTWKMSITRIQVKTGRKSFVSW